MLSQQRVRAETAGYARAICARSTLAGAVPRAMAHGKAGGFMAAAAVCGSFGTAALI